MKISPINFSAKFNFKNDIVEYVDLSEITQGGPEIGKLFINNEPFLKEKNFGGPLLYYGKRHCIILPIYTEFFFNNGFKIIVINLKSKKYKISKKMEKIILFKSIVNDVLEYHTDLNNTGLKSINIENNNKWQGSLV